MSKKLAAKSELIHLPPPNAMPQEPARAAADARPKTAPGSMLNFMQNQSVAFKEADHLRSRFDGALPVRKLDPALIKPSRWANRHASSYQDADFAQLRQEIVSSGGNVQPIKVRSLKGQGTDSFEIVFGHRRHQACLELGLPVLALVEDISEQQLFVEMDRENRQRKDLSAWEQGQMYARALDEGLYPSNRQLALGIGRDLGDVGKALALARLPKPVIEAFATPLDLQFRWAKPLSDAQQKDPEGLLARAKEIKKKGVTLSPRDIYERLLTTPISTTVAGSERVHPIKVAGKLVARIGDQKGRTTVVFERDVLPEARRAELAKLIADFLATS